MLVLITGVKLFYWIIWFMTKKNITIIKAEDARRVLLEAQGLADDPARNTNIGTLKRLIMQMGYVQVDTINVVHRAHHLTLASRLDNYEPGMLTRLLENDRFLFEHWTHDACVIPSEWFRFWKLRFERQEKRIRENNWWMGRIGNEPDAIIEYVLKKIHDNGPLMTRDFQHLDENNIDAKQENIWWGWKPQKAALEYLWHTGKLLITQRENFHKVYDLAERVLPAEYYNSPIPTKDENIDWACRTALDRLVFATPREIRTYLHAVSIGVAKKWCEDKLKQGEISQVLIEDISAANSKPRVSYAVNDWGKIVRKANKKFDCTWNKRRMHLLCPFDPILRDRSRVLRLFNFDYRFEAFVPAAQRKFGYYVLPILEGDKLIGRLDPKFHRDKNLLKINKVWWEAEVKITAKHKKKLMDAVERLAGFLGAGKVEMSIVN